ncbi:MAG: prolipoprotein diacylglyceryl transferase [Geobacteraceae bacterium]|nr:prolipoprotein diacylglyceryl transferase [Geobacteraceae bacterium]
MTNLVFWLIFIAALALYLFWGITVLPHERWQFLAAVPVRKKEGGEWDGVNLTWYGLLTANAYAVAVAVLFILLGAIGVPFAGTAVMAAILLSLCVPASRLVARVVEKKAHTFTVGGAVFVGVLMAPWVVLLINRTVGLDISPAAALAALAIAYAFGEGLGRLACISFGCCYGRRLADAPGWLQRTFAGLSFTFAGKTRKIAYAGGLEGVQVLPVQALTAILYVCCGLAGIYLFLHSLFAAAFLLAMVVTQGWRILSETLRDDYRGGGRFSAYQVMGLVAILYGCGALLLFPATPISPPAIADGLAILWHPAALLFLQGLWLAIFLYTGRSTVTGALLSFHVHRDRI